MGNGVLATGAAVFALLIVAAFCSLNMSAKIGINHTRIAGEITGGSRERDASTLHHSGTGLPLLDAHILIDGWRTDSICTINSGGRHGTICC